MKYEYIIQLMEEYVEKCSNRDLRNRLRQMDESEKQEKLKDILSTEEYEDYKNTCKSIEKEQKWLEAYEKEYNPNETWQNDILTIKASLKAKKEKAFQYEVQIFRKHEPKTYSTKEYKEGVENEKTEITNQKLNDYTITEQKALKSYFMTGYLSLNDSLWHDKKLSSDDSQKSKAISKAIHKNGLTRNTILYNGGHATTKKIGDTITFKGFTSTSYNKDVAYTFESGCIYKFLAPKDTPCFNANMENYTHYHSEHEVLLDKNLTGKIVGFDGTFKGVPVAVVQL